MKWQARWEIRNDDYGAMIRTSPISRVWYSSKAVQCRRSGVGGGQDRSYQVNLVAAIGTRVLPGEALTSPHFRADSKNFSQTRNQEAAIASFLISCHAEHDRLFLLLRKERLLERIVAIAVSHVSHHGISRSTLQRSDRRRDGGVRFSQAGAKVK